MKFGRSVLPHLPYILIIWIFCGAIYLKTLAPSILYVDAGTMIAAANSLGIPNPPGFPTYVLISHLFTKISWGTVLFRVQLVSVISALGVLTLVYFLIQRLVMTNFWFVKKGSDDSTTVSILGLNTGGLSGKLTVLDDRQARICGLAAALILAFSYQFWSQTLNTESYIFTNFFMISLLSLVLTIPANVKSLTKRLILGGVLLGIASGVNPTIIQVVPALGLATVFFWKHIGIKRSLVMCFAVVIFTALVYSYLPLRASQYPFLNWGNPQTLELFWGHLKGEGLDINDPRTNSVNGFTGSPQIFARSVGKYFYLLFVQFTPLLLPVIGLGIYYLFYRNKRLLILLLTVPLTNLIFGGLYLSGNQESWFIASYVILAIFIGIGLNFGLGVLERLGGLGKNRLTLLLPFAFCLLPLLWYFPKLDRSSHLVTSEYADNLYANLPQGTILIGSGDFFNSLSEYEHEAVKKREDVFPVVANMWYILPWYRENLRHQRPDLMPQELEGMIKKDRFEEYNEVMNWYIKWLIDQGYPVYVTSTVFQETVLAGTDAGKYRVDAKVLKAIPRGLSYRILAANDLLGPSEELFNYKFENPDFYKNPPFYLERNYKAAYHLLLQDYGTSYLNIADLFIKNAQNAASNEEKQQNRVKAEGYIRKAYDFASFSPEVVNRVAIFYAAGGDLKQGIKYFKEALGLVGGNDLSIRLNLARSLIANNQVKEAKKEFKIITEAPVDPSFAGSQEAKNEAQLELSKITTLELASNIPQDWKSFTNDLQGFNFSFPPDWVVKSNKGVIILSGPGNFSINFYGGILKDKQSKEEWVKGSLLQFPGKLENKGLAQIPPFEATAAYWQEGSYKYLEFVLVKDQKILHLKVGPVESKQMQNFDPILSTLKFVE